MGLFNGIHSTPSNTFLEVSLLLCVCVIAALLFVIHSCFCISQRFRSDTYTSPEPLSRSSSGIYASVTIVNQYSDLMEQVNSGNVMTIEVKSLPHVHVVDNEIL